MRMKNASLDFTGAAMEQIKTATKNGSRLKRGSEEGEALAYRSYVTVVSVACVEARAGGSCRNCGEE